MRNSIAQSWFRNLIRAVPTSLVIFLCSSCGSPNSQALSDWSHLCANGAGQHIYRVVEGVDGFVRKKISKTVNLDTEKVESEREIYPTRSDFLLVRKYMGNHVYRYTEFELTEREIQSAQSIRIGDRGLLDATDPVIPGFYRAEIGAPGSAECSEVEKAGAPWRLNDGTCFFVKKIDIEYAEYQVAESRIVYKRNNGYGTHNETGTSTDEVVVSNRLTGEILADYRRHTISWPTVGVKQFVFPMVVPPDAGIKRCPTEDFNLNAILKPKY
jgi:hypothetical protein